MIFLKEPKMVTSVIELAKLFVFYIIFIAYYESLANDFHHEFDDDWPLIRSIQKRVSQVMSDCILSQSTQRIHALRARMLCQSV